MDLFDGIYHGKTVFLTGHTGFKGSWMVYWLCEMGAKVIGFSLPQDAREPGHRKLPNRSVVSWAGDIRQPEGLRQAMHECQPDIVFHMAAQSLVRLSYENPIDTYATNVMGTLHVLEAARQAGSVKAVVNITSDKAYDNKEWVWGYRETDALGGHDPYSSSKGCTELLTSSYRSSYFADHRTLLASARAGNVIGGGDWAKDRIVPDMFKAAARGDKVKVRNPDAVRPWQHVLEPLSGYLLLGQKLLQGEIDKASTWNFGPCSEATIPVEALFRRVAQHWDAVEMEVSRDPHAPHEAQLLKLDCSKAQQYLKWEPVWNIDQAVKATALWYKDYFTLPAIDIYERSLEDLNAYVHHASGKGAVWASGRDD